MRAGIRGSVGLALVLCCPAGVARAQAPQPIATVYVSSNGVSFQPLVSADGWSLTVTGPNEFVFARQGNRPPSFSIFDRRGEALADGAYQFELRALQPPAASEPLDGTSASGLQALAQGRDSAPRQGSSPAPSPLSGSFTISGGSVVVPSAAPESLSGRASRPAAARGTDPDPLIGSDQVIPDDLIVQGSLCVGLDCVNNESFGFDTIRMKENNTRIKFEDTSVGTFPTNDWQLTANNSASGSSSKFSIEDITGVKVPFTITAGAATNSIFVDSTGRLGLRTSTPVLDIHSNTSNTPALRFEQNSSGGFTAQTWDVAGNEANFFVRDVTGGSRLPLRIRPGAPTSSLDISASGDVGIGTASPSEKLHVKEDVDAQVFALVDNATNAVNAAAVVRAKADVAQLNFQAHATSRTVSRFGVTLGGWGEFLQVSGNGLAIGTIGATPLILGTSSTNRLHISGAGDVGIGTATPLGKLDVNGSIYQRGGVLFADYVFEPSYKLQSIEDHAQSMWKDKHLPAMTPRRKDAAGREVIELGAHTRGLLEELEKAHIYITQLNERIKERDQRFGLLETENARLAGRLARLEALLAPKSER